MRDNLLKIENPEQEGYTIREENGIKYIEKKELINHEKHGECVSYFQQEIKIDENNNTIIKQRNDLYKNNKESTMIESNVVTFENGEFKDKSSENYTAGILSKRVLTDKI